MFLFIFYDVFVFNREKGKAVDFDNSDSKYHAAKIEQTESLINRTAFLVTITNLDFHPNYTFP